MERVVKQNKITLKSKKICLVKNCYNYYGSIVGGEKVAFFQPRECNIEAWKQATKKPEMKTTSRVCSTHFEPSCIVKGTMDPLGSFLPFERWHVQKDAVPSLNLSLGKRKIASGVMDKENLPPGKPKKIQLRETSAHGLPLQARRKLVSTQKKCEPASPPTPLFINSGSMSNSSVDEPKVQFDSVSLPKSCNKEQHHFIHSASSSNCAEEQKSTFNNVETASFSIEEPDYFSDSGFASSLPIADGTDLDDSRSSSFSVQKTIGLNDTGSSSCFSVEEIANLSKDESSTSSIFRTTSTYDVECLSNCSVEVSPNLNEEASTLTLTCSMNDKSNGSETGLPLDVMTQVEFDSLVRDLRQLQLPQSWSLATNVEEKVVYCTQTNFTKSGFESKIVHFVTRTKVTYFYNGTKLQKPMLKTELQSAMDVFDVLQNFQTFKACQGFDMRLITVPIPATVKYVVCASRIKSTRCRVASQNSICAACSSLKFTFARNREPNRAKVLFQRRRRAKFAKCNRSLRKLASQINVALQKLKDVIDENVKLEKDSVKQLLEMLGPQEREVVETFARRARCKPSDVDGRGMRYSPSWLVQCALLRMKSFKVYRHLRETKILPLPSLTVLRKMLSCVNYEFGFNEVALASIQQVLANKDKDFQYGTLMWDEIVIEKGLNFDTRTWKVVGVVDYGGVVEKQDRDGVADHCLLVAFRPFKCSWVQPIGVFATKGAATGTILAEIITKSIVVLHKHNAIVKACVSDGAATNKAAYNQLGVSGKHNGQNSVDHPSEPNSKIYFFFDVPHLLKTTRNNMLKYGRVQFGRDVVDFQYYKDLFTVERDEQLLTVPNLSESHIAPTAFQQMNVRLAAQLFSATVANSLRHLRDQGDYRFKDSLTTENFTRLLNEVFDILNGRCKLEAVNKRNWEETFPNDSMDDSDEITELQQDRNTNKDNIEAPLLYKKFKKETLLSFLEKIDECDESFIENGKQLAKFASPTTIEAWRLTITSAVCIIEECFADGFRYFLTGKLNQDPVERLFGIIRSIDSRPTPQSILQIFRMLALYTPTKLAARNSNVSSSERMEVLVSYHKCLIDRFKNCEGKKALLKKHLKDQLYASIVDFHLNDPTGDAPASDLEERPPELQEDNVEDYRSLQDHTYSCKAPEEEQESVEADGYKLPELRQQMIVYDLCGYLLKSRAQKIMKCEECYKSVKCEQKDLPQDFKPVRFTATKNRGGLTFATVSMFNTFLEIEKKVNTHLRSTNIYLRDSYERCLKSLAAGKIYPILCNKHRQEYLPYLIMEYVAIRYHFETKRLKKLKFGKDKAIKHTLVQKAKVASVTNITTKQHNAKPNAKTPSPSNEIHHNNRDKVVRTIRNAQNFKSKKQVGKNKVPCVKTVDYKCDFCKCMLHNNIPNQSSLNAENDMNVIFLEILIE